jgi:uncharacterized protein (TIGR02145 family)
MMKTFCRFFLAFVFSLGTSITSAQTPSQFNYQAVLRNVDGTTVNNQPISVKVEILQGSASGTIVFTETHSVITSAQGLVNLQIGSVNSGLSSIDWGTSSHFVRISVNDVEFGTSQLLSVPYAMHAKNAKKVDGAFMDAYFNEFANLLKGSGVAIIDFIADTTLLSIGQEVQFTYSAPVTFTTLQWDFGDGTTSSELNPTHVYSDFGLYTVTLTASNELINITETKNDFIHVNRYEISDIEGNVYQAIKIGNQIWMAENLRTTTYNDGEAIPHVTGDPWMYTTTPAYCWVNDNPDLYKNTFGAMYNSFAVTTGKLCPTGWRVSNYNDWVSMANFLGGMNVAGGKLKAEGTTYWKSPNSGATNEVDFNALGAGLRRLANHAYFQEFKEIGYFWAPGGYYKDVVALYYNSAIIEGMLQHPRVGISVRCVKE